MDVVTSGVFLLSDFDVYSFKQGRRDTFYEKFGSHLIEVNGTKIGGFNEWNVVRHPLSARQDSSGILEEALNSDAIVYRGPGIGDQGKICAEAVLMHGRHCPLSMTLLSLSTVFFQGAKES